MEEELDIDISTKGEDWIFGWTNYLLRTPILEIKDFFESQFGPSELNFEKLGLIQLLKLFHRLEIISEYRCLKPNDDRMEYFEFQSDHSDAWGRFKGTIAGLSNLGYLSRVRKNVEAGIQGVAAVVKKARYDDYLKGDEKTLNDVINDTFDKRDFCDKYAEQPCIARGTAFLIREDLLLTAMHNLYDAQGRIKDEDLVYIFDFRYDAKDTRPTISPQNVYTGKLLGKDYDPFEDWALIRLDPKPNIDASAIVPKREPLKLHRSSEHPWKFKGFYSAGFSLGIPLKLVLVGHYVKRLNKKLFAVNLDLFHGNSGSPIITLRKNMVVGLLISGFADFEEPTGNCIHLKRYKYQEIGKGFAGERIRWIGNPMIDEINKILIEAQLGVL